MNCFKFLPFLLFFCTNFTQTESIKRNLVSPEKMCLKFMQCYDDICALPTDHPDRENELRALLAQVNEYYYGLPGKPAILDSLYGVAFWGIVSRFFSKDGVMRYCCLMAMFASSTLFTKDLLERYKYDTRREIFAVLESLQASIQERLDQYKRVKTA